MTNSTRSAEWQCSGCDRRETFTGQPYADCGCYQGLWTPAPANADQPRGGGQAATGTAIHPFAVRALTSGYTGRPSYIVVRNPGGRRVSTEAYPTPEIAQASADELNIAAMVRDYADDPRPYAVRLAEAAAESAK